MKKLFLALTVGGGVLRRMKGRLQSHNRQILVRLVWLVLMALGLTTVDVTAADWPEHLTLHEKSRSPDGHYGIVVTTSSHVDDGATILIPEEGEEFVDYFTDLQTHRLLGKIKGFEYVEGENHAHLDAEWTRDSKLCIATYWERYGFASAVVLEPEGDSFTQTDIGQHIRKEIDATIKSNRAEWRRMCIHNFTSKQGQKFACSPRLAIIPSSLKVLRRIMPLRSTFKKMDGDLGTSDYRERQ
jgi:hypothetical protein